MAKSTAQQFKPFWVGIDWGTTNLRYWVISKDTGDIIETGQKCQGIKVVLEKKFEDIVLEILASNMPKQEVTDILCCGMIGSKQGWQEVEYVQSPCSPQLAKNVVKVETKDSRLRVQIIPGIKQSKIPDMMRGEETQILGFLNSYPNFEGIICFTGTHTKWVKIGEGEVIFFETFMTGEIYDILLNHSMIKFSALVGKIGINESKNAALEIFNKPYKFSSHIFKLRADDLLNGVSGNQIKSRLSGYIIGLEIAGSKNFWLGSDVVIVGNPPVTEIYNEVLKELGIKSRIFFPNELALSGLKSTYRRLLNN